MDEYRGRAYRRYARHRAISRKRHISKVYYGFDWYTVDGRYDKGKIHCGCGLCKFGRKYGLPTFYDRRLKEKADDALAEYFS